MCTVITPQNNNAIAELRRLMGDLLVRWDEYNLRRERYGGKYYEGVADGIQAAQDLVEEAIERLSGGGTI